MERGNRIAVVSVINDLATDSRVLRTAAALRQCGYTPLLIGRKLPDSLSLDHVPFTSVRMTLLFKRGPAFYFFFQIRLFLKLLFQPAALLFANDLDTLLPNFLISKIRRIPLIYDSHEIFCEVPELQNSGIKKRIWEMLERYLVPRTKHRITVNNSIARYFEKKYGVSFRVVRNIPSPPPNPILKTREELGLPRHKKIILMQGAGINKDRGAEELVEAMRYTNDDFYLLIIGGGDVWPQLQERVRSGLTGKVKLIGKLPKTELYSYTSVSDLGVSIDKGSNLNYRFSLPNKLFDYIHAGLPVLASNLPEVAGIISQYNCGDFLPDHSPEAIAHSLEQMLEPGRYAALKKNAEIASGELTWEKEKDILCSVIAEAEKFAQSGNNYNS